MEGKKKKLRVDERGREEGNKGCYAEMSNDRGRVEERSCYKRRRKRGDEKEEGEERNEMKKEKEKNEEN